ncbi:putative mitochondrial hypothetical protein [Leptomonas pyrrhocoris]|uniref:ApaG domain-containing protein n=1 Tax=Leptomonas pyrrhocoris TaxID=157538 RepID=A0A0M9GBJ7_LEPPY|nr:putative mitochondrial hypothetical protein [Leptomonas pyrrhocoris]KPA86776.1 putative mitochondrial hypothetical protein [Leptomonas pyrrhocoris]|eukprot:XP_015665215.1 putative mitochondrial hypothetical protein [Leptomonas pyrrhocoris]
MSVARSAYRQLLRVGTKVSDKYTDPNDMCFALFGLLVTRQDFVNAGYSGHFPTILRTCFLRPSVRGDAHDTVSARISAAFDALRRLNEINASNAAFRIRDLRRQMADTAEAKDGAVTAEPSPEATKSKGGETGATASASTSSGTAAATGTTSSTGSTTLAGNETPASTSAPPADAAAFSSPSSPPSTASALSGAEALAAATSSAARAASHSKTGSTTYRLDEGVDLIRGSVLIERSSRRRIQNFPRHCVVCEPISMLFPPYRFCLPPEPAYLLAVRNEFVLYGITDVLLALSATSILNTPRPACHRGAEGVKDSPAVLEGGDDEAAAPRGFPTTRAELQQLVRKIPTRTVIQTDVLEVEITTEYVCSNPATASNGSTSTSHSTAAAAPKKKSSMDGAFTSTTPLKGGPTPSPFAGGDSSSSGGARHTSASSTNSATSGPGSALSEDDDTKAHLFLYYVYVRNRGPQKNPHRWHAQVLSHHFVVVDVAQAQVLEMGRPGVMGNFPLLPPGASHCFESGTTLSGPEGFLRGSIQVNLFNDAGEMMMLDAAVAPTRLTVEVTSAKGFTSGKNARDELVQRSSEGASSEEGNEE